MMKEMHAFVLVVVVAGLLALPGCSGTSSENADLKSQVKRLQTDLDQAKGQRDVAKQDGERLLQSLQQAESDLAQTKDASNKLQLQLQDLTKSRDELTAKVNDLSAAKTDLQSKVNDLGAAKTDLQAKVDDLTAARIALEAKVKDLDAARTGLQRTVADLTQSRDNLQKTVQDLTAARSSLEKQVADLTKARNTALEDAKSAQAKIDQLNGRLKVQAQQMTELQDQITNIRAVLEHLQKSLQ